MPKELETLSESVMKKIHTEHIKMRPKAYFILGSILTFIGLVASILTSIFLFSLLRFSLRSHGPMGEYRWEQLTSSFPWWAMFVAFFGIIIGIWCLRQYDFSYKKDIRIVILGFILAIIVSGWILDMTGLNDVLSRQGPMKGMMRQYAPAEGVEQGPMNGGWRMNR